MEGWGVDSRREGAVKKKREKGDGIDKEGASAKVW